MTLFTQKVFVKSILTECEYYGQNSKEKSSNN